MSIKYIAAAAILFSATGVAAQPLNMGTHTASSVRSAATSRHAVLDNIMGRVQMDALINNIVDADDNAPARLVSDAVASGNTKVNRQRRGLAYVSLVSTTQRTRG